jgi:hypothetical protein
MTNFGNFYLFMSSNYKKEWNLGRSWLYLERKWTFQQGVIIKKSK